MKTRHFNIMGFAVVAFALLLPTLCIAQSIEGTPTEPDVPLDGGLSLLAVAGIGYAAKRMRKAKAAASEL